MLCGKINLMFGVIYAHKMFCMFPPECEIHAENLKPNPKVRVVLWLDQNHFVSPW